MKLLVGVEARQAGHGDDREDDVDHAAYGEKRTPAVSRLERQDDMLLSNLYAYVKALGGEVEILAKFPEREVRITQFKEIAKLKAALSPKTKTKQTA